MSKLKNKICIVPFTSLEIHDKSYFMCCPSWLTKRLPNNAELKDVWNSQEAQDIRKSVMDGTYEFCDNTLCPYLNELDKNNLKSYGPIKDISELPEPYKKYVEEKTTNIPTSPSLINFSFDRTCNFMCPSCRNEMIVANTKKIKEVNATIKEIEDLYSQDVVTLYLSGTADPFVSVSFRNFLRNFNPEKYPKLKNIHLHTNASMWNKEMWDSMPNIHKYVTTCEISIDAGTKNTYENVTRLGGNWDKLIENLEFISTIKTIQQVKTSFVVQTSNYKEMYEFVKLINRIFGKKSLIFFGKITNWGTFSEQSFESHKIWDNKHPEHSSFLEEFNKVCFLPGVFHNLQEFVITKSKTLI